MRQHFILILVFALNGLSAQNVLSSNAIDGAYVALVAEKGPSGPTKDKVIQLAENNGTTMLAVAACERCFPAMYTYNKTLSEQFGNTVFMNSFGIYALQYDTNSFVVVVPSLSLNENFSFYNFYTKKKEELTKIDQKKIEAFALPLLDYL
ncbi:hypothetical protein [Spongiimicrobium salis]|uniref:hypothetical protein n=1 Tax=Spongiimicrobium salis TaxID=1667022 RepID=UPI00374D2DB7